MCSHTIFFLILYFQTISLKKSVKSSSLCCFSGQKMDLPDQILGSRWRAVGSRKVNEEHLRKKPFLFLSGLNIVEEHREPISG